jgi:SAM-dependent methyltransferase
MSEIKRDYVEVVYSETERPLTEYPQNLANYIYNNFIRRKTGENIRLLDIGCGRGEFLKGFICRGVQGFAVDQSDLAKKYCPEAELRCADIENDGIPYPDNFFDVVFSKSVIEHFHYPEKLVKETFRVLKPGGLAITLCPSWEHNYRTYFEDFSHRTPFMLESLRDIQLIYGFENVKVRYFRQLPSTWYSLKFIAILMSEITRFVFPSVFKRYSKWIRFSKEIMLFSTSTKPNNQT